MGMGVSPGTGAGSCSVAGVGFPSIAGVECVPVTGMGLVASSSSMIGLKSPVSGGTGWVEVEYVTTGAWVLLALPISRSNLTSRTS